ncbi:MAG TPA: hypothetical protein VHO29_10655 [Marmoricola sp.]|nr:hypothetical protein [Marmoricola sp.]
MRLTSKRVALTAATLTPLLLAAACGGGAPTASGTSSTTSAASSSASGQGTTAVGGSPASPGAQTPVPAESNPPGDIPDNIAFVPYTNAGGHYTFTHPEGWLEQTKGPSVTFTDKLNGVFVQPGTATTPPTSGSAKSTDVPALQRSQAAFELRGVSDVSVPFGKGVRIVYRRNSAPDQVTGRQYRDEVERYELVSGGHEVIVELFGPVGADNVDAYRTMVQSLRAS